MPITLAVLNPVYIYGEDASEKPQFTVSGNTGAVVWATNNGTLTVVGNVATLNPDNKTRLVIVTATDDLATATATVQIFGRFPLHAYFPHDADIDQTIEYSQSEDKSPESEYSSIRGDEFISFNYVLNEGTVSMYKTLRDFRRDHAGLYFYYVDLANMEVGFLRFNSPVRRRNNSQNNVTITCVLIGKLVEDYNGSEIVAV